MWIFLNSRLNIFSIGNKLQSNWKYGFRTGVSRIVSGLTSALTYAKNRQLNISLKVYGIRCILINALYLGIAEKLLISLLVYYLRSCTKKICDSRKHSKICSEYLQMYRVRIVGKGLSTLNVNYLVRCCRRANPSSTTELKMDVTVNWSDAALPIL